MDLIMARQTFLSADIGGTNSRFVLHETRESGIVDIFSKKYLNKDFSTFKEVFRQFFSDANIIDAPLTACLAFAGPVKDNRAELTNRKGWEIVGSELSVEFGIGIVQIANDFLAVGYGLLTLNVDTECVTLQSAPRQLNAPIACIGAGTGLGECFLTPSNGSYECFPTEGGHAEWAPRNEVEIGLLKYLKTKFGQQNRISVERVVSGTGLANIYEYLSHAYPERVTPSIHGEIEKSGEMKGAVISSHLSDSLCAETMNIFVTAYGAEAGVAGLKWLPYGGLYLTGGLTPKNINLIKDPNGPFMKALMDKGRVSNMLKSIPIYAVLVEDLGERGARFIASKLLKTLNKSEDHKLADELSCNKLNNCDLFNHALVFTAGAVALYCADKLFNIFSRMSK